MDRVFFGWGSGIRLILLIQFLWSLSYYIAFSSAILFFVRHFGLTSQNAIMLVTIFPFLTAFFSGLLGYIQDHALGLRRSMFIGLVLLSLGFILLIFSTLIGSPLSLFLYISLGFIALGRDILGLAIYSILGMTYYARVSLVTRLDTLIILNYTINGLGIFLGTIIGWIFFSILSSIAPILIAGILALFTLFCFITFSNFLVHIGNAKDFRTLSKKDSNKILGYLSIVYFLIFCCLLFPQKAVYIFFIPLILGTGYLIFLLFSKKLGFHYRIILFLSFMGFLFVFSIIQRATLSLVFLYFQESLSFFSLPLAHSDFQIYTLISTIFVLIAGSLFLLLRRFLTPKTYGSLFFFLFRLSIAIALFSIIILWASTHFLDKGNHIPLWFILLFSFLWSFSSIMLFCTGIGFCVRLLPKELLATGIGLQRVFIFFPSIFILFYRYNFAMDIRNIPEFRRFFASHFLSLSIFCFIFLLVVIGGLLLYSKILSKKRNIGGYSS